MVAALVDFLSALGGQRPVTIAILVIIICFVLLRPRRKPQGGGGTSSGSNNINEVPKDASDVSARSRAEARPHGRNG